MFDEQLAGYLQLFSFPLILFGVILWAIDLADPQITCRLVARIGIRLEKMQTKPSTVLTLLTLGITRASPSTQAMLTLAIALGTALAFVVGGVATAVGVITVVLGSIAVLGSLLVIGYLLTRFGLAVAGQYSLPALGMVSITAGAVIELYQFAIQLGIQFPEITSLSTVCLDCEPANLSFLHFDAILVVIFYFALTIASISLGAALSRSTR